jgi:hypothetical protein
MCQLYVHVLQYHPMQETDHVLPLSSNKPFGNTMEMHWPVAINDQDYFPRETKGFPHLSAARTVWLLSRSLFAPDFGLSRILTFRELFS